MRQRIPGPRRPRLLVLGAGTGPGSNLIRSLRAGDPSLFIVGAHDDRFVLKKSAADRNYLIPAPTHGDFAAGLRRVIEAEAIDLLIPGSDTEVGVVSGLRHRIPCRVFLPRPTVIDRCQDKYRLTSFLRSHGVPAPATYPVTGLDGLEELFDRLASHGLLWCRIRTGSASMGAVPVRSPEQARGWISYWEEMRGVPAASFTLSEYLPGRDFGCQSLWKGGRLVLIKTFERLSYIVGGGSPSGVSSAAALAKTVAEPRVVEVCTAAVRALDRKASGIFSVDLKEDQRGVPSITEINVGRFLSGTNLFDLTGKHNMAVTYARLALGEPVTVPDPYDVVEDHYMVRDLDTLPGIFQAEELFDGVRDARSAERMQETHPSPHEGPHERRSRRAQQRAV